MYILKFKNLSQCNSGNYKALGLNKLGKCATRECLLEIEYQPIVEPKFEEIDFKLGETNNTYDVISEENKSLNFTMKINAMPKPIVEWYKDNTKIKLNDKKLNIKCKDEIYELIINEIKNNDAGNYKITAKNTIGECSFFINLKIKSKPQLSKGLKNKIECIERDNLELNCTITQVYPQPEYKWYKGEELLEMSNVKIINEKNVSKLLIESIDLSYDLSKLKFIASNELGSCETETTVEVYVAPKFIFPLNDAQPQLNKPFEWNFEIDSHPEPKLKFFKNEKELNLSKESRIRINKELNLESERKIYRFKLNFVNILADDFGSYKIEAQNKAGVTASQANLTVIGSPCFTKKPLDTNILVGKPLKIEFEIAGIPNPDIEWFDFIF